jgi:hypothetical protein
LRPMTKPAASDAAVSGDRPVSARVLATWLDCSRSYVTELEDRAVLKRVGGKLPLRASVAAYVRFLRQQRDQDQSPRSEAAAEHHRLKAQLLGYQIAKHEREHITIEEHNHFVDTVMGLYLSSLAQLPAIMGGNDLTTRRKWEAFVFDTRKRLADKALQLAVEAERMIDAEARGYVVAH